MSYIIYSLQTPMLPPTGFHGRASLPRSCASARCKASLDAAQAGATWWVFDQWMGLGTSSIMYYQLSIDDHQLCYIMLYHYHYPSITGWWLGHPSEKYESQLGDWKPNIWGNKKCSKPPTRSFCCHEIWVGFRFQFSHAIL